MLTDTCIEKYREQYPLDDCFYGEPNDLIMISNDENVTVIQPIDETEAVFLDRLERSKKAGKNLFFEEWNRFEYEEGMLY